jgi:hypothetical protein
VNDPAGQSLKKWGFPAIPVRFKLSLAFAEASRGRGFLDGFDPDVFATSPEIVAVTFDASPYLERKLSTPAAHQSGFAVTTDTLKSPPPSAA